MKLKELQTIIGRKPFDLTKCDGKDCRTVQFVDDSPYRLTEEELESEIKDISLFEIWI